jgi:tetratricopeptide (TPR) repeat protein
VKTVRVLNWLLELNLMKLGLVTGGFGILLSAIASDLESARDRQDVATLEASIAELSKAAATNPDDAGAQYRLALAHSYLSEVAFELRDKAMAKAAAEAGIHAAERAVTLQGDLAEHYRILGTLCGQVIPSNVLSAFRYGKCAMTSINKALELDPDSSQAYLSRGVGNYYLPTICLRRLAAA